MGFFLGVLFGFSVLLLTSFVSVCGKKKSKRTHISKGSVESAALPPMPLEDNTKAPNAAESQRRSGRAKPADGRAKVTRATSANTVTAVASEGKKNGSSKVMSTQADSQPSSDPKKKDTGAKSKSEHKVTPLPQGRFGAIPDPSLRKTRKSIKRRMSRERVEPTQTQESQRRTSGEQEDTEEDNTMDGVKSVTLDKVPSEAMEEAVVQLT